MGSKQEVERGGKRGTFPKGIPDFHVFIAKKSTFPVLIFTLIYKITKASDLKKFEK